MAAKKTTINKSEFIRSQPSSLSAAQVIAKGKAQGIKIAPVLVYKVRGRSKAKKNGGDASRGPVLRAGGKSKAAFVRDHGGLTAKEVVAKAKSEGIRLTEGYVYNVRTYDKKSEGLGARRRPGRPPGSGTGSAFAENLLRAVAAEIGLGRAIDMLQGQRSKVRLAIAG